MVRRGSKRSCVLLLFASFAACVPARSLQFPELEGTGAVLVLSESDGALTILGFDRGKSRVAFTVAQGGGPSQMLVLSFPHTLKAMGLWEGRIEIPSSDHQARALPLPETARYGANAEGPVEILESLSVEDARALELFKRTKIPELTPARCADHYGCYTDDDDRLCLTPCEASPPEVERPRPFENLPQLDCAWTEELIAVSTVAVELAGLKGCRPIREASCTSDQYWRPGFQGCRPVTSPCPLGADPVWSSTTAPNSYYVHAGAVSGGDGSIARPFATIAEAVRQAGDGATLLLSASTFAEHPSLGGDVTLIGACERTEVSGFSVTGGRVRARDLVLNSMADRSTIDVARGGALDLARVIFRATSTAAVHTLEVSGTATVADALFDAPAGNGITVTAGRTRIRGIEIREHHARGFYVAGGEVQVTDSLISGAPGANRGISVLNARVEIARTLLENSGAAGIHAADNAMVTVSQSLISGTRSFVSPLEGATDGTGIFAQVNAVVSVDRTVIEDAEAYGIIAQEAATFSVRDSIVQNVGPGPLFGWGDCLYGYLRSTVNAERFVCINAGVNGINLTEGVRAELRDVAIVDLPNPDGVAVAVEGGATAILDRISIVAVATRAVVANGRNPVRPDKTVVITDLEVRGAGGGGLDLNAGAQVRGARVWLEQIGGFGVLAKLSANVELRDLTIRGVSLVEENPACEVACPGDGLLSTNDGAIDVQNFDISSAIYSGARLTFSGDIDLAFGRISDSGRALFVDREGFDVRRLLREVVLEGEDPFEAPPPP